MRKQAACRNTAYSEPKSGYSILRAKVRAALPSTPMPPKRRRDETTQMTLSRAGTLRAPAQQTLGFKRAAVEPSGAADAGTHGLHGYKGILVDAHGQQLERASNAVPEGTQVKEERPDQVPAWPVGATVKEEPAVKLEQVSAWPVGAWVKKESATVPSAPAENTEGSETQQSRSTEEE